MTGIVSSKGMYSQANTMGLAPKTILLQLAEGAKRTIIMGRRRRAGPVSVRIPEIEITRSTRASEKVQLPGELLLLFLISLAVQRVRLIRIFTCANIIVVFVVHVARVGNIILYRVDGQIISKKIYTHSTYTHCVLQYCVLERCTFSTNTT